MTSDERREVVQLIAEIEKEAEAASTGAATSSLRPGFAEMAEEIFEEHRELMARLAQ